MGESGRFKQGLLRGALALGAFALVAAAALFVLIIMGGDVAFATMASVAGCALGGLSCILGARSALRAERAERLRER